MLINEYIKTHHKIIKADKVLLVAHLKPDGDAIASLCAMADLMEELKKDYTLFTKDIPPIQYHFLPYFDKIKSDHKNLNFASYDLIIVLDCGQLDRTGLTEEIKNRSEKQYVIEIDHHPKVYDYADLEIRFTEASATAEILYYFFKANNIKINNDIEELINIRLYCMSLINMSDFTICRLTKTITAGTYEELGIIKTQNKPVFILSPNEWVPGWVYSMFPNTFYYDNDEEKLLAKLKSIIENKQNLSKKEKLRWLRLFWE